MSKTVSMAQVHPMVVFWLGLLTGAVIVSLIFLYRILVPVDFESSILRNPKVPKNLYNNRFLEQQIFPSPTPNLEQQLFPSPTPNIIQ
ncbi:hypothetical protein HY604_02895 [Candidatus Peregrinibacteria bacterium]|nr:hypothetical protein [Candidatus Peregrinibacteria bacterium]